MSVTKTKYGLLFLVGTVLTSSLFAQDAQADNMLLYQRQIGGWPKHINEVKVDYTRSLSESEKAGLLKGKTRGDATIDNQATTKEIRYLLKAYSQTGNKKYVTAAENGIRYLLQMQHPGGGFPQFYPDSSSYRAQITYNDNAMIHALEVLRDVAQASPGFEAVDASLRKPCAEAVEKGIDCIVKTQIQVNGVLTGWCAQHDRKTFLPTKARAFEPASISSMETVGIVRFLLKVEQPSGEVKAAIQAAVQWLDRVKIEGYKTEIIADPNQPTGKDRVLQPQAGSVIWARFYDIETNRPFFCGRDGKKKDQLAEIENERRVGYAWYGAWAEDLLAKQYPKWMKKMGL